MTATDARTRWGTSLWHALAPPRAPAPALAEEIRADLAVVGAGFAGLSTALHAAERGLSVAIIEGETLAWGASGRNAGFVVPNFARADPETVLARLGTEPGERLLAMLGSSADLVFDLVRRHAIACDALQSGWIQPAHSDQAFAAIRSRAAQWQARGRPVEVLDGDALRALTGVSGYRGGWIDRSGGVLDPAAYAHGLARAAQAAGVRLFERSPVTAVTPDGKGWRVATAGGAVQAGRVVLATNAYGALVPALSRSFIPLTVYQIATQPLPPALRARILPERQAVSDSRRNLFTFRLDAADRLISGGMAILPPGADRRVAAKIHRRLARLLGLPDLPPIAHAWSGRAAVMPDFMARLVELAPGLVAPFGCNGRGIAVTTAIGCELAAWAAGQAIDTLAVPSGPPAPLPWHGLLRHAPHASLAAGMVRDALDARRTRQ